MNYINTLKSDRKKKDVHATINFVLRNFFLSTVWQWCDVLCCAVLCCSVCVNCTSKYKKVCNGRGDCIRHKLTNDCCRIIGKIPTKCGQISHAKRVWRYAPHRVIKEKNRNVRAAHSVTATTVTADGIFTSSAAQYCLRRSVSTEWIYLFWFLIHVCR